MTVNASPLSLVRCYSRDDCNDQPRKYERHNVIVINRSVYIYIYMSSDGEKEIVLKQPSYEKYLLMTWNWKTCPYSTGQQQQQQQHTGHIGSEGGREMKLITLDILFLRTNQTIGDWQIDWLIDNVNSRSCNRVFNIKREKYCDKGAVFSEIFFYIV